MAHNGHHLAVAAPDAQGQAALQPIPWTAPAHGVADAGVAVAGCCWQHDHEGAGQRVGQQLAWPVQTCRLCNVAANADSMDHHQYMHTAHGDAWWPGPITLHAWNSVNWS